MALAQARGASPPAPGRPTSPGCRRPYPALRPGPAGSRSPLYLGHGNGEVFCLAWTLSPRPGNANIPAGTRAPTAPDGGNARPAPGENWLPTSSGVSLPDALPVDSAGADRLDAHVRHSQDVRLCTGCCRRHREAAPVQIGGYRSPGGRQCELHPVTGGRWCLAPGRSGTPAAGAREDHDRVGFRVPGASAPGSARRGRAEAWQIRDLD